VTGDVSVLCVHLTILMKPEITASDECLWTVPTPLRGVLIRYPLESSRIIEYHSVLPFLTSGVSRVTSCYSTINLPPALRAVRIR